mgnify:CR=1 FL=1
MSKHLEQNSITNSSEASSKSVNGLLTERNSIILLGNKTNRGKDEDTPATNPKKSASKSTEHKTLQTNDSEISFIVNKNDIKEKKEDSFKIQNTFDLHEQIGNELNNKYLSQNIILMTDYMKSINELDPIKRNILLDWVMAICYSARFKRETFHMTVSLIDICFSKLKKISVDEFQLLGTTCLLISSKYLEISIPSIKKFSEFTGETYSVQEIKDYEKKILGLLKWKINYVDILQWSNLILYKWNIYINEYSPLFKMNENDTNRLYIAYYYILDSIVLDYNYRFHNMKYICTSIVYLLFGYTLEFIDDTFFDLSKLKYYDNFFNKFVEKNKLLSLDNFRDSISYVSQFLNKSILDKLSEDINEMKIQKMNIFYQDYDSMKKKLAYNAIKNTANN